VSFAARAALAALLASSSVAAAAPETAAPGTRASGTVITAEVVADPFGSGGNAGSLVIAENGFSVQYSVIGTTRLTQDGKIVQFDNTLVGDVVVRAQFDPQTKTLTVLDLKSPYADSAVVVPPATLALPGTSKTPPGNPAPTPKADAPARIYVVGGEVALADAIKGILSVRSGKGRTRRFDVNDKTIVQREAADESTSPVGFVTVSVGDIVEVRSGDGRTADKITIRPSLR